MKIAPYDTGRGTYCGEYCITYSMFPCKIRFRNRFTLAHTQGFNELRGTMLPWFGDYFQKPISFCRNTQHIWEFAEISKLYETVVGSSAWEVFGHTKSVKILVILNPASYMLTSSGFAFIWGMFYRFLYRYFGISPEVSNFNLLFLKLNQFICNQQLVPPGHHI